MAIETLGAALRQIRRLFAEGVISGLPDRRLLDLFIEERDGDAFEVLVARHGPMVLSVCRGILRKPGDVEDAFQATFLVLVKKAATIRGRQALGGWLYQVAHRVAVEANRAAARRRACEREAGLMASATPASGPALIDQLLSVLHEEIARLPEKHRLAVVLCDLEGMTHAQAAGELNWSERTLRRRLAEARERLKVRLVRHGMVHDDAVLGAVFLREAQALVPMAWQAATVHAALDILDSGVAVGSVSLAARSLTREVLRTMFVQKLTIAVAALIGAGLMAWAASAALISRDDEPPKPAPAAGAQRAAPRTEAEADPLDAVGTFPVRGRVLDPDGKPVANAQIYVHHYSFDPMTAATGNTVGEDRSERVAASDADGRFHFDLDKSAQRLPVPGLPGLARGPDRGRGAGVWAGLDRRRDRCSRGARRRSGWSATTCRSAAAWSIRRAGRSPACPSTLGRFSSSRDPGKDASLRRGPRRLRAARLAILRPGLDGPPGPLDDRRRRPVRDQRGRARPGRLPRVPRPDDRESATSTRWPASPGRRRRSARCRTATRC